MHTSHMTTTDFDLTGLRVRINYSDPRGIEDDYQVDATVLSHRRSLLWAETDEDENGDTEIVVVAADEVEIVVPVVLLANETDPPSDRPLIDPDAIDGTYRLEN